MRLPASTRMPDLPTSRAAPRKVSFIKSEGFLRVRIKKGIVDELTFQDLALLEKIDGNTVVESFGSRINSSFFDAANMLGTLKQKGLIEFKSSFPGPSEVEITPKGKNLMALAEGKSKQEIDKLDEMILGTIANGYKEPKHLQEKINLRASDLAFHLKRLVVQNYASFVFRSGRIEFSLTEEGFGKAGYPAPASEEDVLKDGEEVADIIGTRAVPMEGLPQVPRQGAQVAQPGKLDKETMRRAKMEYYAGFLPRYILTGALILILVALAAYLYMKR